jgi:TonB-dependent receptor
VLNKGTGEYVRNAVVTVRGTNLSTVAEAGGTFELREVPTGPQTLEVSFAGLDTVTQPVVVGSGPNPELEIVMSNAAYRDVIQMGKFTVSTEREGNAKAIMEQRNSIEAKQVIASDTFGSISEGNVGEFLKYLPGVMIDYTEADARSVSLGGLDTKYTAVTMDGNPVASSGLAAANGTTASRGFEFEQISINNVESVELSRTPQPMNPGSALAGVVNLRSKGAFDRKGRQIRLTAGLAANSMSGDPFKKHPGWDDEDHYRIQPNYGIEASDVFLRNRLGVLVGYNYSYTFAEQKAETIAYAYDADLTNNATETPRMTQVAFRDSPKPTIRYNLNGRVDFKVSPELWFSARADYNRYHAKFFSRDLTFNFTTVTNAPGSTSSVAGVPYSLSSQTASAANVSVNQGGGGTNKYGATANFAFDGHFHRGDFRADFGVSYSRSQTWYKNMDFGFFWSINPSSLSGLGLRWDRNGPADPGIKITQLSGPDWRNLANYPNGFSGTINDRMGQDQRYLGKADMEYVLRKLPLRSPVTFKFGTQISEWSNKARRPIANLSITRRGADNTAATADENLAQWAEPKYRMNFDFDTNIDGMTNVDRWALYKDYAAHPEYWTSLTPGGLLQSALQNQRDAKEQVDAIYDQTIFRFGRFTIAPGFRVEHTRGVAFGPTDLGDRETRLRLTGSTTGAVNTASTDYALMRFGKGRTGARQDYNTWLRYVHSTYRLMDNLQLKASYNQAISRPDMNWLIGGLVVTNDDPNDPGLNRASAGNANLKPELSETLNATAEYYMSGIGQFSVSGYRRDFKNLIRSLTYTVPSNGTWNGEPVPTAVSTEDWLISTRENVAKAHMSSIEFSFRRQLSFLPYALKVTMVNLNYTNIWYDHYDNFMRANNVANASITVPYRHFKLTWNTNWRPGYRVELITASNGWPKYVAESWTHTFDFTWTFRPNMLLYVTARNVFNGAQSGDEYRGRSDLRTRWVRTGAIWTAGITATF